MDLWLCLLGLQRTIHESGRESQSSDGSDLGRVGNFIHALCISGAGTVAGSDAGRLLAADLCVAYRVYGGEFVGELCGGDALERAVEPRPSLQSGGTAFGCVLRK